MGKRFVKNRYPKAKASFHNYPEGGNWFICNYWTERPLIMKNSKGNTEKESWDNLTTHLKFLESLTFKEKEQYIISNTKRLIEKNMITLEEGNQALKKNGYSIIQNN